MGKLIVAIVALLAGSLAGVGAQDTGRLVSGDYYLEDNTLELHFSGGIIDFMKGTYYPGEGFCDIISQDVREEAWEVHGPGVVMKNDLLPDGAGGYLVKAEAPAPLRVRVGSGSIDLTIGPEAFHITKAGGAFLVEISPRLADGKPDPSKVLSYRLRLGDTPSGAEILSTSYAPHQGFVVGGTLDGEANYIPSQVQLSKGTLKAAVSPTNALKRPDYSYVYTLPFQKDREKNLRNYLIILTQRQRVSYCSLVNAVLLSLYFFDALQP